MKVLAILGAGGHARVVADAATAAGWGTVQLFDDAVAQRPTSGPWPVVGRVSDLMAGGGAFDGAIVAIGDCTLRLSLHAALREAGAPLCTIVHPRAWISPHACLGAGSVAMAGVVVNVGASIGEACILNTGCTVDHDCRLRDGVHVAPGAHLSGGITVGARSWIGVGASVRQGVVIGADALVGAGAVVVSPVADRTTVVGSPARPLSRGVRHGASGGA